MKFLNADMGCIFVELVADVGELTGRVFNDSREKIRSNGGYGADVDDPLDGLVVSVCSCNGVPENDNQS